MTIALVLLEQPNLCGIPSLLMIEVIQVHGYLLKDTSLHSCEMPLPKLHLQLTLRCGSRVCKRELKTGTASYEVGINFRVALATRNQFLGAKRTDWDNASGSTILEANHYAHQEQQCGYQLYGQILRQIPCTGSSGILELHIHNLSDG